MWPFSSNYSNWKDVAVSEDAAGRVSIIQVRYHLKTNKKQLRKTMLFVGDPEQIATLRKNVLNTGL